jgi:hypothetical protein
MVKCGYCRIAGHNIAHCDLYEIHVNLYIIGDNNKAYIGGAGNRLGDRSKKEYFMLPRINIERLAHIKLVKERNIPFMFWKFRPSNSADVKIMIIRYKNNELYADGSCPPNTNVYNENIWNDSVVSNATLILEYKNDYKTRIDYAKQHLGGGNVYKEIVRNILTRGDYIEYIANVVAQIAEREVVQERERVARLERQRVARERFERLRVEQRARQNGPPQHQIEIREQQHQIEIREPLPNIRETAVESDDCPVCFEVLTEVGKIVLRCGHQICTSCLFIQTRNGVGQWLCPVCRAPYV